MCCRQLATELEGVNLRARLVAGQEIVDRVQDAQNSDYGIVFTVHAQPADTPSAMSRLTGILACFLASGLLLTSTVSACRTQGTDDAIKTVKIFDMLVAFPRAQSFVQGPGSASLGMFDVEGTARPG